MYGRSVKKTNLNDYPKNTLAYCVEYQWQRIKFNSIDHNKFVWLKKV